MIPLYLCVFFFTFYVLLIACLNYPTFFSVLSFLLGLPRPVWSVRPSVCLSICPVWFGSAVFFFFWFDWVGCLIGCVREEQNWKWIKRRQSQSQELRAVQGVGHARSRPRLDILDRYHHHSLGLFLLSLQDLWTFGLRISGLRRLGQRLLLINRVYV